MKKLFAFLLTLYLMTSLTACGPSDESISAVRSVSFEDKELTVTLGTNKSTGYEWNYEIYGDCIRPSINRTFKITGSQGDATGEVSIGFEGISEGSAVIVFNTPNGWDGTGDGDSYTVNVAVNTDGTIKNAKGADGASVPMPTATSTPIPTAEPTPSLKTTLSISELAEGTYTGTLSGCNYSGTEDDSTYVIEQTVSPADITATIKDGQAELYCAADVSAVGTILGVKAPRSPDYTHTVSGELPLTQIDTDTVSAEGDLTFPSECIWIYWDENKKFDRWDVQTEDITYHCSVSIAMADGVPTAQLTIDGKQSHRTGKVLLQLKGEELLSAPYAAMLKSGDYQYTYALTYDEKPYTATIATYKGMICRKIVSDDGTYSMRVVTIDGNAWTVDDLTGAVVDGGTENAETLPDYASTLTFVAAKTLETGAIAEAYDFKHEGQKCNMVFVFTPEKKLSELVLTVGEKPLKCLY